LVAVGEGPGEGVAVGVGVWVRVGVGGGKVGVIDGVKVGRKVFNGETVTVFCDGGGVDVGGRTTPAVLLGVIVGTIATDRRVGSNSGSRFSPNASERKLSGVNIRKIATTITIKVATTNITAKMLNKLTAHPPPFFDLLVAAILFTSPVYIELLIRFAIFQVALQFSASSMPCLKRSG
jgi:hypothetical protein